MKRLLLTILCLLFAYPCFAAEPIQLARMNPWVAGSAQQVSSCTNKFDYQEQVENFVTCGSDNGYNRFCGQKDYVLSSALCSISVYVYSKSGTTTANWYAKAYTASGNNLGTLVATSNPIEHTTISTATWITFTFSSDISPGTYSIVVEGPGESTGDYMGFGYKGATATHPLGSGTLARWNSSGTYVGVWTDFNWGARFYGH